eukprot:5654088-Prorocentrum_lima.AAC.1
MASRQGEQQAFMNCKHIEQMMLSEYQHNLRLCRKEEETSGPISPDGGSGIAKNEHFPVRRTECT